MISAVDRIGDRAARSQGHRLQRVKSCGYELAIPAVYVFSGDPVMRASLIASRIRVASPDLLCDGHRALAACDRDLEKGRERNGRDPGPQRGLGRRRRCPGRGVPWRVMGEKSAAAGKSKQ